MTTEGNSPRPGALPVALREIKPLVQGRTDAVLHEGLATFSFDPVLEHLFQRVLPANFDASTTDASRGTVRFLLGTPAGERSWSVTRNEGGLEARHDATDAPGATITLTLANFLRLITGEKSVAAMLDGRDLHVTGDANLARAFGAWLKLPA